MTMDVNSNRAAKSIRFKHFAATKSSGDSQLEKIAEEVK